MSIIVRCSNGHFYDAEKTKECPYCNRSDEADSLIFIDRMKVQPIIQSRAMDDDVTQALPSNAPVFIESATEMPAAGLSADRNVTESIFRNKRGNPLVCGWLVGVKGPVRGQDYRIFHGINWVGSGYNSDVIIHGDSAISTEKHCGLVYEGRYSVFYVIPGTGTITYFNEKLLVQPETMKLGDNIKIGNSVFEFIPYCREGHTWEIEES